MIDFMVISQPLYIQTGMSPKLESTGFTAWKDYNKTALRVVTALQETAPNIKDQSQTHSQTEDKAHILSETILQALFSSCHPPQAAVLMQSTQIETVCR